MSNLYFNPFILPFAYLEESILCTLPPFPKRQFRDADFRVKYKTELCRNWELGTCEFGENCAFAHGQDELRNKTNMGSKYKTKKCKQFHEQGYCIYGNRCQFKHRDLSEETSASSPKSVDGSTKKLSEDFIRRRLPIFIDITSKGEYFL
jgi:hypothetical protein